MFQQRPSPQPQSLSTKVVIPDSDVRFETARSSGPGGQNVNKVETKVRLLFNLWESKILSTEQKRIVFQDAEVQRMTRSDGIIAITSQEHRSQWANKQAVLEKLNDLIGRALTPKAERVPTDEPPSVAFNRQREKKVRSEIKKLRRENNRERLDSD